MEATARIFLACGSVVIIDSEMLCAELPCYSKHGERIIIPANRRWGLRPTDQKWQYATSNVTIGGKKTVCYLHRLIVGAKPGQYVDHINSDRFDCRRSNLRLCTHAENIRNMEVRGGSSQYKGVYFDRSTQCWRAQIRCDGKHHSLGRFTNEVDAANAYNEKAKELFGEFARLNPTPVRSGQAVA